MGFMLRIILGLALVLTACSSVEPAAWRYARETLPEEAPEISPSQEKPILNESKKEEITNNIINKTNSDDNVQISNKPKTENGTEKYVTAKINKEVEDYEYSKEDDTDTSQIDNKRTTEVPDVKHTESLREESARSIDINKYISEDFHDRNNVYTLPISPDTEKYTNLHNDIIFTTATYDFSKKQKDIETEVNRKLEYIDSQFAHAENDFHDGQKLNISEILEKPKDNDTNTDLQYIKYKNITSSYNKIKNKVNKETDTESGQTINYNSSYNKTHIYDDTPKDYKNKISTDDEELNSKLTHKAMTEPVDGKKVDKDKDTTSLTKPPSLNRTSNHEHLISNRIEPDSSNLENVVKTKGFSYSSTHPPPPTTYSTTLGSSTKRSEKETTVTLAKRGSTKYFDTISTTTEMSKIRLSNKHVLAKKQNQTFEEVVQENQVFPIQVPAPTSDAPLEKTTTEDTEYMMTSTIVYTTPNERFETTTDLDTTTVFETTTDDSKVTTVRAAATTEEASTLGLATDENLFGSIDTEASTMSVTESTADIYNSTTETDVEIFSVTNASVPTAESATSRSRGFNLNTNHLDHTETIVTNKTILATSQKITVATEPDNATTTEAVPTTSDYRDNIIVKHTDSITTTKQPKSTKYNEEEKSSFNESKRLETKTTHVYNTTDLNVNTRMHMKTTTDSPLIIPLNTSMYETEVETTTHAPFLEDSDETSGGKIAAIVISSIGAVCLILLAVLLFVVKKRHKRFNYGQRCTPVSLDAYSVDNVSVYNSMRRKGAMRASKRSYGNPAFDDPTCTSNQLNFPALAKFTNNANAISSEFEEVPQVTAQTNELPEGCETKNRYANVIPLPETRVFLSSIEGYPNSDYINANYVTGPKSSKNYYIACQAPMQNTVEDFWRMIWEQQSKVILMLTHLFENGGEKCIDYLPPSEVLDCHRIFGDYQITLKKREVKEKYVISILQLKNMVSNSWREVTHLWYLGWPEKGVPSEANSLIAFLIEARSYVKALPPAENGKSNNNTNEPVANGSAGVEHSPIVVHCSPGTGRTGTVIACDIAIREFELSRQVDIPKTVYRIRRDRASSVQTKEQYAFIYNVITLYATKLTGGVLDSL